MHGKSFQARFRSKNAAKATATPKRIPRSRERFAMITVSQVEKLLGLEHVCWPLFTILRLEDLRHHGRAFVLPIDKLATIKGLSQRNLRRTLCRLEGCGLISVRRDRRNPPQITVL